jgi:hydrogenase expression/formation protein HypE
MSLSFIIEEGFPTDSLKDIIKSIKRASDECSVRIVTGDTKVVEKGCCDGIYINTAGIGIMEKPVELGTHRIIPGDSVIVSGTIGDHGLAVLAARENLFEKGTLKSDCASICDLARTALKYKEDIRIMRDPTRGGLATTLKEFAEGSPWGIRIYQEQIPVKPEVRGACDILGIDPLYAANEGKLVIVADSRRAPEIVEELRSCSIGSEAAIIGVVIAQEKGRLLFDTGFGTVRVLDKLSGAQLPRIC